MRLFACDACGHRIYFENVRCERCGHVLGYIPERVAVTALEPGEGDVWQALAPGNGAYRFCVNAAHGACNWLIAAESPNGYCLACWLNRTIPDLGDPGNLLCWQRLEAAKHRVIYALMRFDLPLVSKHDDQVQGLAFDFLADPDPSFQESARVMTGHARGLITINIAEADDAAREANRQAMAEPYRTLLGHFRHEIGHHYWERLVADSAWLRDFRALFGDERLDYAAALDRHYAEGPPADWSERFISAYASMHPWEDWAESWAHYMHIVDTLETAQAFRVSATPEMGQGLELTAAPHFDPYLSAPFDDLMRAWFPLTYMVNSLNRSMGQPDLYPFVMPAPVIDKLAFIHRLVRDTAGRPA
jgi:hypothetical protein